MSPKSILAPFLLATAAAAQWSLQPTPSAPLTRAEAAITFDLARAKTVMFGGSGLGAGGGLRSDTWTYDGSNWTQENPTTSPSGRFGGSMVFDFGRGVSVMFGGMASLISIAMPSNETWEWNGVDWTLASPTTAPSGRVNYGLAYDLNRQKVVMFGGSTNPGLLAASNQTWEYNGTTWTQITTAMNPGPRVYHGMTFHAALGRTVVFGGHNFQTSGNSDTWLYDGTNWMLTPSVAAPPSARSGPRLVYDSARATCVLQGGANPMTGAPVDETWEWNGASWRQFATTQPPSRTRSAVVYDPIAQRVVLFSGAAVIASQPLTDTWEYGAFVGDLGTGCLGSNGFPVLAAAVPPRLGTTFQSTLTNLATGAGLAAVAAGLFVNNPPLALAQYGMPNCELHVNVGTMVFLPVVNGTMTSQFGIPNSVGLFGVTIHQQGLSLDPGVNVAGLIVSNAITLNIGW